MAFRSRLALALSAAALLVLLVPARAVAKTVRVDCGESRDLGNFSPAKKVVFKVANLGSCCAQVILFEGADQDGNVLLDVTLCPNERINVDRPTSFAASARIIGGAGIGQAVLDFVALPPDEDVNWARHGDHIASTNVGNVGIGTTTPGEKLTVCGIIESKSGGVKFPDGTVQESAAMSETLVKSGIAMSPGGDGLSVITGIGFRPRVIRITIHNVSPAHILANSTGIATSTSEQNCVWSWYDGAGANEDGMTTGRLATVALGYGVFSEATLETVEADGFSLRWNVGSPVPFLWEAYR